MASPWTSTLSNLYPGASTAQFRLKGLASQSKRQANRGTMAPTQASSTGPWGQVATQAFSNPLSLAGSNPPISKTPSGNAIDPFWRDANGYGGREIGEGNDPYDWYDTDYGEDFGEENPQGEYLRFLSRNGASGQDRYSQWARSLYTQARAGYDSARMSNPELKWRRYLATIDGRLRELYASMSASGRGVDVPTQVKTIYAG